ncbi:MAG: hypothetical protein ABII93_02970 [Chrysiogenia bacterium]
MFSYDTYQDVRKNLNKYSIPILIISGFYCYFFIIPIQHKIFISSKLGELIKDPVWTGLLGTTFGLIIFTIFSVLLTEVFQVHDKFYDKYFIKWRKQYDIDIILYRLMQPLSHAINYRFYEEAENHKDEFLERLFYPFVGDRDLKIPKNLLIRFYEVVTIYWLTQIIEFIIVFLTLISAIYFSLWSTDSLFCINLNKVLFTLILFFILNRVWKNCILKQVKIATIAEIRAIHDNPVLLSDLLKRLQNVCTDYKIPLSLK